MGLIIVIWIGMAVLVGLLGRTSTWGGWLIFLIALFCSPVLAALVCFLTQKPNRKHKKQLNAPTVYEEPETTDYNWEDKATLISYATALLNNNFISEHVYEEIRDKIMMRDDARDQEFLNNIQHFQEAREKNKTVIDPENDSSTKQTLIISLLILGCLIITLLVFLYYKNIFSF